MTGTRRRSRTALPTGTAGPASHPGLPPCPACHGGLTADGRCAACAGWLLVGPDPRRPCPTHRTRTLDPQGWCDPPSGAGVWHVAGPVLVRLAPGIQWAGRRLWLEGPVPVAVPRAESLRRLRALLAGVLAPRPAGPSGRSPDAAVRPQTPQEAQCEADRRARLAQQAAALGVGTG
jgi:hypothetical protein